MPTPAPESPESPVAPPGPAHNIPLGDAATSSHTRTPDHAGRGGLRRLGPLPRLFGVTAGVALGLALLLHGVGAGDTHISGTQATPDRPVATAPANQPGTTAPTPNQKEGAPRAPAGSLFLVTTTTESATRNADGTITEVLNVSARNEGADASSPCTLVMLRGGGFVEVAISGFKGSVETNSGTTTGGFTNQNGEVGVPPVPAGATAKMKFSYTFSGNPGEITAELKGVGPIDANSTPAVPEGQGL